MAIVWLMLASFIGWFLSSLAGGGSPLILIPVLSLFLPATDIPPIITLGMLLGNGQRVVLYWRDIDWRLTWWYIPGAMFGSCLGVFVFTQTDAEWLSVVLALFLIISSVSYLFKSEPTTQTVKAWYFLPGGIIYGFLSGLVGSTGPLLNTYYLNYGLVKESMLATKSLHMVFVHVIKVVAYIAFGVLTSSHIGYGILLGLAAFPGNWLGQLVLDRLSPDQFRRIVVVFVALSGLMLLWEKREFLPWI